jgi:hypothetical protein
VIGFLTRTIFGRIATPVAEPPHFEQASEKELSRRMQAGLKDIERLNAAVRDGFDVPEIMGR